MQARLQQRLDAMRSERPIGLARREDLKQRDSELKAKLGRIDVPEKTLADVLKAARNWAASVEAPVQVFVDLSGKTARLSRRQARWKGSRASLAPRSPRLSKAGRSNRLGSSLRTQSIRSRQKRGAVTSPAKRRYSSVEITQCVDQSATDAAAAAIVNRLGVTPGRHQSGSPQFG